jgi:DNA-binding response OmpR family regulator
LRPGVDVLLVEDEPVVREAAARILRLDGFKVDLAEEVSTAVARLREVHPRVVLTDLMLPGFSGFDLLDRLANERPQVPVVLITGYATIENALHAFQHGAFDFLPKPFDVAELLGTMRRALRASQRRFWNAAAPARDLLAADATARPQRLRFLGQHSWAAIEGEKATFGVAESFPDLLDSVVGVSLPKPGDFLTQGLSFAEISTADQSVHRVWAPLSGTVIESNTEIARTPDLLNTKPFSSGWLTRVALMSLEEEQEALTIRSGALAPGNGGTKEKRWSS